MEHPLVDFDRTNEASIYEILVALASPEGAQRATERVYDQEIMHRFPNNVGPSKVYACRDGKCVMAVAFETDDPFPIPDEIVERHVRATIGFSWSEMTQEQRERQMMHDNLCDLATKVISLNDEGELASRSLIDLAVARVVEVEPESRAWIDERLRAYGYA